MKRMLIDAAHPEETRVVIIDNNKIDDFEVETQGKQQLKGNIYIGHVSRVEPSLQAAFITYGGNRNGFLAFGEVHPQFFALKDAEKKELLEELAAQAARRRGAESDDVDEAIETTKEAVQEIVEAVAPAKAKSQSDMSEDERADAEAAAKAAALADAADSGKEGNAESSGKRGRGGRGPRRVESRGRPQRAEAKAEPGQAEAEAPAKRSSARDRDDKGSKSQPSIHRRHRIQDVLKEGQKILVQVVKEERGSKGAALTTYFSLPGRYTVLMPNTPYAGGISRKITDPEERRQLRRAYAELEVPDTMGLIIRTAGVGQDISHIKRDYENLTNLWQHIIGEFEGNDDIQCIHEDGSVIIRALRDMMSDDIEDITISGARAYKMAKDYAKNLMPDVVSHIKQHKEETPLFTQAKVENKLNMLHHNRVTLPSGGYLIIDPTEALVAVDINSGRATQERNIEETALKTNLEACDELARQIRLRDLAGLIVVDFIDMEDHRNVRKVEGALRKALRRDRARIQTGNISDFGLMEISRQRLRPSFGESHFISCPHCMGTGLVHSPATSALMVLRKLEEDDVRDADRIIVSSSTDMVLWLLNHKRDLIRSLEERYKYQLQFRTDDSIIAPDHKLELVTLKADGTENIRTIDVILREQPELPPELRQRGNGRRERSDRDDEPRRERSERPEKQADTKRDGKESKSKDKDSASDSRDNRKGSRNDKSNRNEARADSGTRRPRRIGEDSSSMSEEADTAPAAEAKPARGNAKQAPARKADSKPERKADKPARIDAKVEDQPLAVQKVSVDSSDEPAITVAPRKKFEVKKQADTDADDAPIAVAKVSSEDSAAASIPARASKKDKEKSGIVSRLLGR
jgi:ribonuclease E